MSENQTMARTATHPQGWEKTGRRVLIAVLLGLAALSLIYCLYAVPAGDDYDRSAQAREAGVVDALKERRAEWTGRWTGLGLVMLVGSQADLFAVYPGVLMAFYFATFVALHLAVSVLAGFPVRSQPGLLLSGALFFVYWTTMPAPGESFYWFTGAANEHLTFILSAVVLYLGRHAGGRRAAWAWGGGTLATLALSGIHELYSLMVGYVLLLALIGSWKEGGRTRWYFLTMGLVLLAGFIFVATAPGNTLRAEAYSTREAGQVGPLEVLLFSGGHFLRHITQWVSSPTVLIFCVWLLFERRWTSASPTWIERMSPRGRLILGLAGLLGLFLGFFGFSVVGGVTDYYPRMLNFFCLWSLLLVLFAVLALAGGARVSAPPRFHFLAYLFLAIAFFSGNTIPAFQDLASGTVSRYSLFIRYLDQELKEARSEVYISGVPLKPRLFFEFKLKPDAKDWFNESLARYYGVPKVVLGTRPETESGAAPPG